MMRFKFNARERRFDDCHIHAVQQTTKNDRAEPSAGLTHLRCHEMLECHDLTSQVWEMLAVQRNSDNDTALMAESLPLLSLRITDRIGDYTNGEMAVCGLGAVSSSSGLSIYLGCCRKGSIV